MRIDLLITPLLPIDSQAEVNQLNAWLGFNQMRISRGMLGMGMELNWNFDCVTNPG